MFLKTTYDPLMQFTGKERDAETGLDFFLARYYSPAEGRFITPDWSNNPEPVPYAKLDNPQTLNLYSYVKNNPLRFTDPDGHEDDEKKQKKVAAAVKIAGINPVIANSDKLSNVVENETSSLKPDPKAKPGAPGSAEDLAAGRQAIAEIANRVINDGYPDRVAPQTLYPKITASLARGDLSAIDAHNKSRTATDLARGGSNITNGATQYRTRTSDNVTIPVGKSETNPGTPVSLHYGPFIERKHIVVIVVAP
jgi:RHS repeat-associated protein